VQARVFRLLTEYGGKHLRRQAGATHPQQQHIGKITTLRETTEPAQVAQVFELVYRNIQPVQPAVFVASGPQARITRP
jgi:hypothetical protein